MLLFIVSIELPNHGGMRFVGTVPDESGVAPLAFSLLAGPGAITSVKLFSDCWIGRNNAINCKSDSCYIWHILFDGTHLQSAWQARFINYHHGVCCSSCSDCCSICGRWPEHDLGSTTNCYCVV